MLGSRSKALVAFLLMLSGAWGVTAAPAICVDEPICHFGTVVEGEDVECVFLLKNCGDENLRILSVIAGCGCTATMLSAKYVPPGETTSLKATLHTGGYGGYTVTKSVTVKTNDPTTPALTLSLSGTVLRKAFCSIAAADVISGFTVLLDLRTSEQYSQGHLIGAINIPLDEITQWIDMLPRRVRIVVYDQDGSLVDVALDMLEAEGIAEACGLQGGLDNWILTYGTSLVVTFRLMPPD